MTTAARPHCAVCRSRSQKRWSKRAARIRRYHQRQAESLGGFEYTEQGVTLGSRVTPLARVGVYAPGGKARYPSSVLMCAMPAQVAGVTEIIVASPDTSPEVRAACHLAGVHALLDAGGAQAIAALAYGTESVPRVDKIVGPGNIYVAAPSAWSSVRSTSTASPARAKSWSSPTTAPTRCWSPPICCRKPSTTKPPTRCWSRPTPRSSPASRPSSTRQLADLPRKAIADVSVSNNGYALIVANRDGLVAVANQLAAEHVAVHTVEPRALADRILRAGAIFVGSMTPEAAGDYLAGPSHVLPTGGAARYGAPLGVYDFVSRTSIIDYEPSALIAQGPKITAFARAEGLEAHARAVEFRTLTQVVTARSLPRNRYILCSPLSSVRGVSMSASFIRRLLICAVLRAGRHQLRQ